MASVYCKYPYIVKIHKCQMLTRDIGLGVIDLTHARALPYICQVVCFLSVFALDIFFIPFMIKVTNFQILKVTEM